MARTLRTSCTILSAILYALALISPWASWTIFIFLIPLLYIARWDKLSFVQGFTWGFTFYLIHLFSIGYWIAHAYHYGFVLGFIFLCYLGLLPAVWFWATRCIASRSYSWWTTTIWSVSFMLFFLLQDSCYSWFLPSGCGYWMAFPAIALVTSWSQPILFYFGSLGALAIIIISNGVIFELLYHRHIKTCIALAFLIVFGSFALKSFSPATEIPSWLSHIGYISPRQLEGNTLYDRAYSLKELIYKDKQHSTILMPESMLKVPLNIYPEFCQWWDKDDKKILIMGAHRYQSGNLLNTAFVISEGAIVDYYDKRCSMAFIEQVPSSLAWIPGLTKVLFDNNQPFCSGDKKKSVNIEGQPFDIQICSDFYMTKTRLTMPTLLLVNDDYNIPYFTYLLWRGALYQAIIQKMDILYVGHRKHGFIQQNMSTFDRNGLNSENRSYQEASFPLYW